MVRETVDRKRLQSFKEPGTALKIQNVREVASYSWVDSAHPKIIVPGLPPRWTPPKSTYRLKEDSGDYFRDQNAARYPDHPMAAAIQSVLLQQTQNAANEVRIFGCGSTLVNLLRFVEQKARSFRFRIEVVGKTAIFVRTENSPTQLIEDVYGYGHTFPEAYTTWDADVATSESHQKIIRYNFGGKNVMVRFEADGYLPSKADIPPASTESGSTTNKSDPEDLVSELGQLRTKPIAAGKGSLEIISGGHPTSQSAIFDLKTRSIKKFGLDIVGDEVRRLWINQIPNFILAFHTRGSFDKIQIHDVRDRVCSWETSHQEELQMFSGLLDYICETAEKAKSRKLEVSYTEGQRLELKSLDAEAWSVMPEGLATQWLHA